MTLPEADTTPLAMAAQLIHEVQRIVDLITTGLAKDPWDELDAARKDLGLLQVDRIWGKTFPGFFDYFCLPYKLADRQPPAAVTDENHQFVQYARMLHAIVHGVLGGRETDAPESEIGQ